MKAPLPATELVPLLRDGFMARNQRFMDAVLLTLVVEFGQNADRIDRYAREALAACPLDVREFWESPCDCGTSHLGGTLTP